MVYVNVEGAAPSIDFSKISTKRTDFIEGASFKYANNYTLDLKGIKPGVYFIPMFSGVYQITHINAPFYGLPYSLATEKQEKWRFAIEPNRVNFIGELFIAKERGTNEIEVHLFNRIATYQELIFSELAQLPNAIPLALKPGYQDEFLMELEK